MFSPYSCFSEDCFWASIINFFFHRLSFQFIYFLYFHIQKLFQSFFLIFILCFTSWRTSKFGKRFSAPYCIVNIDVFRPIFLHTLLPFFYLIFCLSKMRIHLYALRPVSFLPCFILAVSMLIFSSVQLSRCTRKMYSNVQCIFLIF